MSVFMGEMWLGLAPTALLNDVDVQVALTLCGAVFYQLRKGVIQGSSTQFSLALVRRRLDSHP